MELQKRKKKSEVTTNTLNEKLDMEIILRDIERTHRIGELLNVMRLELLFCSSLHFLVLLFVFKSYQTQ